MNDSFEPGRAPVTGSQERPWISPGPLPQQRRGVPWWVVILLAVISVSLFLAAFAIQGSDSNSAPLVGKDSGVAVCEILAEHKNPAGKSKDQKVTPEEISMVREMFADSRHTEIRDPGVRMMDLSAQLVTVADGDEMAALPLVGPFTESYASLAGGCSAHGYLIPPLSGYNS